MTTEEYSSHAVLRCSGSVERPETGCRKRWSACPPLSGVTVNQEDTHALCRHGIGVAPMVNASVIGIYISKKSVQAHGATVNGAPPLRRELTHAKVLEFLASRPQCLVVLESCGGTHYWGKEIQQIGQEVRLIAPIYVNSFGKRRKSDARDAATIMEGGVVLPLPLDLRRIPQRSSGGIHLFRPRLRAPVESSLNRLGQRFQSRPETTDGIEPLFGYRVGIRPTNSQGNTSQHVTAARNRTTVPAALVTLGADLNAKNRASRTPLDAVCKNGRVSANRMLVKAGKSHLWKCCLFAYPDQGNNGTGLLLVPWLGSPNIVNSRPVGASRSRGACARIFTALPKREPRGQT